MLEDPQSTSAYAGAGSLVYTAGSSRARGKLLNKPFVPRRKAVTRKKPEIIYMPISFSHSPLLDKVRDLLPDQEIYLVGGAVRDMLLNRISHDLDFALPSKGVSIARKIANALQADFMALDEERDTGRVIFTDTDGTRTFLDFATYRGNDLDEDIRNRDFTINAIAFDIHKETVIDPLNGAADLRAKLISACSPTSLDDDPIRILRAVRQAAAFEFKIELETRKSMKQAAHLLPNISPERQRDELFKILEGPKPDAAMRALEMLGVFPHLLPELPAMNGVAQSEPHIYDVWEHTLSVLNHLDMILASLRVGYSAEETKDIFTGLLTLRIGRYREQLAEHFARSLNTDRSVRAALFFAALYHDVQKPDTRFVEESGRVRFLHHEVQGAEVASKRGQALNLSNDEIDRINKIVRHHMRFHFFTGRFGEDKQEPSRKAIYRFFREAGEAGVDLILLGLADLRGMRGQTLKQEEWVAALDIARILLENYWERPQEIVAPPRLIDGNELMKELNLVPGRIVGQLLEAIREGQATGKISTREEAISFARDEMMKLETE